MVEFSSVGCYNTSSTDFFSAAIGRRVEKVTFIPHLLCTRAEWLGEFRSTRWYRICWELTVPKPRQIDQSGQGADHKHRGWETSSSQNVCLLHSAAPSEHMLSYKWSGIFTQQPWGIAAEAKGAFWAGATLWWAAHLLCVDGEDFSAESCSSHWRKSTKVLRNLKWAWSKCLLR